MDSTHVVVGGTGGIGRAVVAELLRRGKSVRAVSRQGAPPEGAEERARTPRTQLPRQTRRGEPESSTTASIRVTRGGRSFCPPVSRSILRAAESSGAKLVFADNLYAYGRVEGPLREDLPAAADGPKGRTRVEVAAEMLAADREGRVRVTVGRASDYYGPGGVSSTAGEPVFGRVLAGKRPQWTGKLDVPHTFHYLPDVARGLVTLAEHREANGEIWHLPAAEPLTAQEFFDLVCEAAGRPTPAKARIAGPAVLAVGGIFSPTLRELRETAYLEWFRSR